MTMLALWSRTQLGPEIIALALVICPRVAKAYLEAGDPIWGFPTRTRGGGTKYLRPGKRTSTEPGSKAGGAPTIDEKSILWCAGGSCEST